MTSALPGNGSSIKSSLNEAKEESKSVENEDLAPTLEEIPYYQELKSTVDDYLPMNNGYGWMVEVFLVLIATAFLSFFAGMFLRFLSKAITQTHSNWDDIFVEAMRKPLKAVIWLLGIFYAIEAMIKTEGNRGVMENLADGRDVIIVFIIAWAMIRYVNAGFDYFIEHRKKRGKKYDYTAINALSKLIKIAILIAALLIALQSMGVSISAVLAFGGIGGIAIGFAAKDMLANFFGAFIIYFDKPFKVGDWVRSPDQEIEGTVEDIGWRITTIRTFDKRPLYVPNSVFSNISVENPSRMTHRRIYETVGIRYDDIHVMDAIVSDTKQMLKEHEAIDESQTLIVNFNAFNSSSCDFFVYCFTHTTNWIEYHSIKQDVLLQIAGIIDGHGAEIAYPTQVEYSLVKNLDKESQKDKTLSSASDKNEEDISENDDETAEQKPKDKTQKGGEYGPEVGEVDGE